MEAIKVPVPRLAKGETLATAIDRLGQQAKELRLRLAEIEQAPQPSAQARARLKEQFAALARRGEISVDQLLQREGGQISFPETQVTLKVYNVAEPAAAAIGQIPDIVAMLVYANHDSLLALQDKKLAAAGAASDARALTIEQRQKQMAQTMDALFAVELDQATLTLQAWESGLAVEANTDLLPAAWLAVANVVPPPADKTTSPGHAYSADDVSIMIERRQNRLANTARKQGSCSGHWQFSEGSAARAWGRVSSIGSPPRTFLQHAPVGNFPLARSARRGGRQMRAHAVFSGRGHAGRFLRQNYDLRRLLMVSEAGLSTSYASRLSENPHWRH